MAHRKKTTSTIVFFIIFTLIAIGAVLSVTKNSPETSDTTIQSLNSTTTPANKVSTKQVTITYTSRGFIPSTTTINKGDTVVIVNRSNDSLWPVSIGYPIISSDFDASQPVVTGQSYSFTFDKGGTFIYFNHLKPAQLGALIIK